MRTPERCNCGALDCPRCRPTTYKDYLLKEEYEQYVEASDSAGGPTMEYDDWLEWKRDFLAYMEELKWEKKREDRQWKSMS